MPVNLWETPMNRIIHLAALFSIALSTSMAFGPTGQDSRRSSGSVVPAATGRRRAEAVTIWSDGTRMAGDVYRPKNLKPDDKLPAIVFIHGTGGVKKSGLVDQARNCVRAEWLHFLELRLPRLGRKRKQIVDVGRDACARCQRRADGQSTRHSLADGLRRSNNRHSQRHRLHDRRTQRRSRSGSASSEPATAAD